jgi:hypothetical protein
VAFYRWFPSSLKPALSSGNLMILNAAIYATQVVSDVVMV